LLLEKRKELRQAIRTVLWGEGGEKKSAQFRAQKKKKEGRRKKSTTARLKVRNHVY